jgi:hypothetical protein
VSSAVAKCLVVYATSVTAFAQIRAVDAARLARRMLARTVCNQVPKIQHQHVVAEFFDDRFLTGLPAPVTTVTGEAHHPERAFGERWPLRDHSNSFAHATEASAGRLVLIAQIHCLRNPTSLVRC